MSKETGNVKWFDDAKGFGFIEQENREDIFVHYSEINGTGRKTLHEGERVQFSMKQGERGKCAADVDVIV